MRSCVEGGMEYCLNVERSLEEPTDLTNGVKRGNRLHGAREHHKERVGGDGRKEAKQRRQRDTHDALLDVSLCWKMSVGKNVCTHRGPMCSFFTAIPCQFRQRFLFLL